MDRLDLISKYYYTIKYLKFSQVFYRTVRLLFGRTIVFYNSYELNTFQKLTINDFKFRKQNYLVSNHLNFLNIKTSIDQVVKNNWNYNKHGMLWNYNLNYLEWIHCKHFKLNHFYSYYKSYDYNPIANEPYPTSLRNIFLIQYCIFNNKYDSKMVNMIKKGTQNLVKNIELHLSGNHLLENAFSLLWSSLFFKNKKLYLKSCKILNSELNTQILDSGAHYEMSPMYHSILLTRLIEIYDLLSNNNFDFISDDLKYLTEKKIKKMFFWLKKMTFETRISLFGDSSVSGIAHISKINAAINKLNFDFKKIFVNDYDYDYYRFSNKYYTIIVDSGRISADHIPGHCHADAGSFELEVLGNLIFVDKGISSYDNPTRNIERSTHSHNTVTVNNKNQIEIWSKFRLARRRHPIVLKKSKNQIKILIPQYNSDAVHTRLFSFEEKRIFIKDKISKNSNGILNFNLINFKKLKSLKINNISVGLNLMTNDQYYESYNRPIKSKKYTKNFRKEIVTEILI